MAPGYQTVIDDDTEDPFADSWPVSSRGSVRTHSPEVERWRPLVEKYFPPDAVEAALAVMEKESGGNPSIPSAYNSRGTEDSHGLFQVNIRAHRGTPQQWSDPETNVKYAAQLYKTSGWQPWRNSAKALGLPTESQGGKPVDTSANVTTRPYTGLPINPWQPNAPEDDSAWRRGMLQAARDNAYAQYQKDADIPEYADKWLEIMLDMDEQLRQLDNEETKKRTLVAASASNPGWYDPQTGEYVKNEYYTPPAGSAGSPRQPSYQAASASTPGWVDPVTGEMRPNPFYASTGASERAPSYQAASTSTPGYIDPVTGRTVDNPYYAAPNIEAAKAVAEAERAWEQAEAQREREAAMQRQRTATAGTVAGIIDSGTQFAIPRLRAPGQTHFPGYEPGGAYQQLMLRAGVRPTNDTGRVVQTNYDPAASWEQARRLLGI